MSAHVYQIKREQSEKEIIIQRKKVALFNALMHTLHVHALLWLLQDKIFWAYLIWQLLNKYKIDHMEY